jgi:hypothetical protein
MAKLVTSALALTAGLALLGPARAQVVIGSYDNFDCFNDTGREAEGFEIDIEDVQPSDITRIFPDNFPAGQPYIRYGTPDKNALTLVTFPDGHTGVSIIYKANYVSGAWQTTWGSSVMPGTATPIGNGTPFVAKPTYTTGESCWTLGLGANYPASGCDHFGISLAYGKTPGKITYHWLVPDPANPGSLIQNGTAAAIPPSPVLAPNPPVAGQPPVVHAVAEAPENDQLVLEGLWGTAYWVKTFTSYSPKQADLNKLQFNYIPRKGAGVTVSWTLLQRAPPAEAASERDEVEDDAVQAGQAQVIKRYEYYAYNGSYDPETHEAMCGGDGSCDVPQKVGLNGKNELGKYLGAHNNAFDVQ